MPQEACSSLLIRAPRPWRWPRGSMRRVTSRFRTGARRRTFGAGRAVKYSARPVSPRKTPLPGSVDRRLPARAADGPLAREEARSTFWCSFRPTAGRCRSKTQAWNGASTTRRSGGSPKFAFPSKRSGSRATRLRAALLQPVACPARSPPARRLQPREARVFTRPWRRSAEARDRDRPFSRRPCSF